MANRISISPALFLFIFLLPLKSFAFAVPDSTGLPGDNLDLAAVLNLFKSSTTLEDFEKKLNTKENHINNLDLDGDNHVDYIRVVDHTKDKIHAIVLQVSVDAKESQDVAVIELEKTGDESAQVQIVGDEELYGEKYIIEPDVNAKKDSLGGKWRGFVPQVYVVNVWYWLPVKELYSMNYAVFPLSAFIRSQQEFWCTWTPLSYGVYRENVCYFNKYYCRVNEYRISDAQKYYNQFRNSDINVQRKYTEAAQKNRL